MARRKVVVEWSEPAASWPYVEITLGMMQEAGTIFRDGMLLGMDTLVAQAFGAKDVWDTRRTLVNGIWLGTALAPLVVLILWSLLPVLRAAGVNPRVMEMLGPFIRNLLWGVWPLLLYSKDLN